jgi:hypothetical protein
MRLVECLGLAALIAAVGCGEDAETGGGGGKQSGGDGGGGAGGGTAPSPTEKPPCPSPGGALGGTPDPRADTAGALSADGRTFLVFGGDTAIVPCGTFPPPRKHAGDTWLLDTACGGWTEVTGASAPSPRARHAVAFDSVGNRALLFGGRWRDDAVQTGPYTLYNDVWAFDFATRAWSELATTGPGPSPRSNTAAVVVAGELVVFGGSTSTDGAAFQPQNDAFALDLGTGIWRSLAASTPPPARLFHSMAADAAGSVYVFSGGDQNAFVGPFLADAWRLDLGALSWQALPAAGLAAFAGARIKGGLALGVGADGNSAALFAFGGHDDGVLGNRNDVLRLDAAQAGASWEQIRSGDVFKTMATGQCDFPADFVTPDLASPERRSSFAFGALPAGGAFVVFGGDSDCGRLSDAWWFDTVAGAWTEIRATLPGLSCARTGNTACQALCF